MTEDLLHNHIEIGLRDDCAGCAQLDAAFARLRSELTPVG